MAQTTIQTQTTKSKKRPFELVQRCQNLSVEIHKATALSQKEYRVSICKQVQNLSYELIHTIRIANTFPVGSKDRKNAQADAYEEMERINDLIPVMRKLRCITIEQEEEICKKLKVTQIGFQKWLEADRQKTL